MRPCPRVTRRRIKVDPTLPRKEHQLLRRYTNSKGNMEDCAHGRAYHLSTVDIRRTAQQDHPRPPHGIRCAQDRSHITGILHAVKNDIERRLIPICACVHFIQRNTLLSLHYEQNSLRTIRVGECGKQGFRNAHNGNMTRKQHVCECTRTPP